MRRPPVVFASLVLTLSLTAFAYWPARPARAAVDAPAKASSLRPGVACKLYFRGDAAGQSVQSYVASVSNNASLSGTLVSVDDQWVVVAGDGKERHVPRAVVLMIEVPKP